MMLTRHPAFASTPGVSVVMLSVSIFALCHMLGPASTLAFLLPAERRLEA